MQLTLHNFLFYGHREFRNFVGLSITWRIGYRSYYIEAVHRIRIVYCSRREKRIFVSPLFGLISVYSLIKFEKRPVPSGRLII